LLSMDRFYFSHQVLQKDMLVISKFLNIFEKADNFLCHAIG